MNAPISTAQLSYQLLERTKLRPSPTNPRKRKGLDIASLTELSKTMAPPVGIIEPLVIREKTEIIDGAEVVYFEIIAGERRWRASEIAGLTEIPCIIRQLSDAEVLAVQLIENKRREDLDALEEAEGYEKLLKEKDSEGKPITVDSIAKAMGVSKGTIYARMKLLDLCLDVRQAFYDGKLDASTALLIARIPAERLQIEALTALLQESGWSNQFTTTGDKMSYRKAKEFLQDKYMLDLDRAPFDTTDAILLPKAGNCTDCPKRTGNARDLFDDVEDGNVCTDTVCFGMKKAAHVLKLQKAAEAEGAEVIKGKQAKKLIANQWQGTDQQLREHGYATLDTPIPGDKQNRTLKQMLEEEQISVKKTVVANPHREGQMIETVNIEAATKALREAGFEVSLKGAPKAEDNRILQRAKEAEKIAIENTFRGRLFDTLHAKIEADMLDPQSGTFPILYRRLATQMFDDHDHYAAAEDMVCLLRKFVDLPVQQEGEEIDWRSHIEEFRENIPHLTPAQHLMLIIELPLIVDELSTSHYAGEAKTMLELAKDLGIDASEINKQVEAEAKAAQKAAAKDAKKSEKKAAASTGAAQAPQAAEMKSRLASTWPFPEPKY